MSPIVVRLVSILCLSLPLIFSRAFDAVDETAASSSIDPFAPDGFLGSPLPTSGLGDLGYEQGWYLFRPGSIECLVAAARTELDPPPADVPSTLTVLMVVRRDQPLPEIAAATVSDEGSGPRDPAWRSMSPHDTDAASAALPFSIAGDDRHRYVAFRVPIEPQVGPNRIRLKLERNGIVETVEGWPFWARPVCGGDRSR
ncbi:MAG TPA: hypothetical protein PLI18_07090 [Pirellulaceae bacterium]|nr:hypothetical protein [Pirellulaceae bacterium]